MSERKVLDYAAAGSAGQRSRLLWWVIAGCGLAAFGVQLRFIAIASRRIVESKLPYVQSDLAILGKAIDTFEADTHRLPTTQEGIAALLQPPPSMSQKEWNGPYVKRPMVDPWGNPYVYRPVSPRKGVRFQLLSLGEDGVEGTADDVRNW